MNNNSNRIKASAHHAFMQLGGIHKENQMKAKEIAINYFIREYGRELSMKENDDLDQEFIRLEK